MAGHESLTSFVAASLLEYLVASKLCLEFQKEGASWHSEDQGGCLGTSSALLLLCVVDTIGSYLRYGPSTVMIDGKKRKIDGEKSKHFFVLNLPEYYGQNLSSVEIESIYEYRNLLAHNAATAEGRPLLFYPNESEIFPFHENRRAINLPAFHNRSCDAVERLLSSGKLIEESHTAKNIRLKAPPSNSG
jgi:hypothetical protein